MILEEIRSLLLAGRPAYGTPPVGPFAGIVESASLKIHGNAMPQTPDTMIALYDQSPFEPERAMGYMQEVRNLQTLIRAPRAVDAELLAYQCFNILDTFKGVLLGVTYYGIMARSVPFSVGTDENSRFRYSCNFKVDKARS